MVNYHQALELIQAEFQQLRLATEEIPITDSLHRILAEDVIADVDLPPFDNAAVDGYAVRDSNRREWRVVGEIAAGKYTERYLEEGEAILVTTGSRIPPNTDTVIPLEDTEREGNIVRLKGAFTTKQGSNIRITGSDLAKGSIAVAQFTRIDPKIVAVLASCGRGTVRVFKQLTIAILATGDELIPIHQVPVGDKLRVSNPYALAAAVRQINHIPLNFGFVRDDLTTLRDQLLSILHSEIDILITTGGISVGKHDLLREVFEELGVERKFWKVNIKPGKPTYFGVYRAEKKKIFIFGLPGNPVSALVGFYIFVKPAIESAFGLHHANYLYATLQEDIRKEDTRRYFAYGTIYLEGTEWKVIPMASQSSGNLVGMSRANCLIELDEERVNPRRGEKVRCIPI